MPTDATAVPLYASWNLVGHTRLRALPLPTGLLGLTFGVDVDQVARYDKTTSTWVFYPGALSQLIPQEGYWVRGLKAKTWSIPAENQVTRFVYDGDGGRVKVITPSGTTMFVGSSYEVGADGTKTKSVFAGSQRMATKTSAGSLRFFHPDHLGSVNVVTDRVGIVLERLEYTPYGSLAPPASPASSSSSPWRFTGQRLDPTGLYFYNARYYDPQLGRFTQADPTIQHPYDPQDLNRYTYCRNNPVNLVDPTGYSLKSLWRKISGFAAAAAGTFAGIVTGNPLIGIAIYSAIAASGQSGNFARNFGINFASGVVGYGLGAGIASTWGGGFWSGLAGASLGGAGSGAVTAALLGGNIGQGALAGLVGGTIGYVGGHVWPLGADALAGGVAAEINGGSFGEGALQGGLHRLGESVGGILGPMPTAGSQGLQAGDVPYFKPNNLLGWGIALFEGGVFSHTGTMITANLMAHSDIGAGGTGAVNIEKYSKRGTYVSHRFRGNQAVINTARALAAQQITYGLGPGQKVCSTCNATAFNQAGYSGWYGIGPNSQAQYHEYEIPRTYGR